MADRFHIDPEITVADIASTFEEWVTDLESVREDESDYLARLVHLMLIKAEKAVSELEQGNRSGFLSRARSLISDAMHAKDTLEELDNLSVKIDYTVSLIRDCTRK